MKRDYRLLGAAILLLIIALMLLAAALPFPLDGPATLRFAFSIACGIASLRMLWLYFSVGSL